MSTRLFGGLAMLAATAVMMQAQKPKSQKEVDAIMAIQNAQTADARIQAVEELITKFPDTEFKSQVLNIAGDAAAQKRDNAKAMFYYDDALKADPKNFSAMLMLAGLLAQTTREFDLDREEKLTKAEKYAHGAMDLIPKAEKPQPATEEQWAGVKKDLTAQAHEDLGLIASVRKKHDVAVTEFKAALDGASNPEPATMVRLAGAYTDSGQPDQAVALLDKVLAIPNVSAGIKSVAQGEKARAEKAKSGQK